MTEQERHIMRHALGLNRAPKSYRNSFVAGVDHFDYAALMSLVERGYMAVTKYDLASEMEHFRVTDAGRQALPDKEGVK